jgi:C_GCAxxG_C_C family probable redox protein
MCLAARHRRFSLNAMNAMTSCEVAQRSEELFQSGLCCAESVLQAIAESRGIQSELIPRIATGLCGGIARTGGICGALSGGVLGISIVTGRNKAGQSTEVNARLVRALLGVFEAKFGATECKWLIGCRLDTPEGQQFFKENKLREQKCRMFVKEAAAMASGLLEQAGLEGSAAGEHPSNRTGSQPGPV